MGCRSSKEQGTPSDDRRPSSLIEDGTAQIPVTDDVKGVVFDGVRESVYYDAHQSAGVDEKLPDPAFLYPYLPASSAPAQSKLMSNRLSMDQPRSLLYVVQHQQQRRSVRESVIAAKNLLTRQRPGIQLRKGYPGDLTNEELESCLQFREELKKNKETAYREMVYSYRGVEDEAFALCRYLRARKFVVPAVFAMMEEKVDCWKAGRKRDFYPDFEASFGCPLSVFWSQFPLVYSGVAKSGAIVYYFKPGRIQLEEGIECIGDVESFDRLAWYISLSKLKQVVSRESQDHPTSTVLVEKVGIFDLQGMPSSLCSQRVINMVKNFFGIQSCFPETLNNIVVVNAPGFFSMTWAVMKKFVDPRTVAKIGIYSSQNKAMKRLSDLIDSEELLSDYGGTGPSFDTASEQQQLIDGNCSRQLVERMTVSRNQDSEFEFHLSANEKASVVVYTKADGETPFLLHKYDEEAHISSRKDVKRKEGSGKHYSVEIASTIVGPGKFKLVAKSNGSTKEHFLVAVSVVLEEE